METKSNKTLENTLSLDSNSLCSKQKVLHPFMFTT